MGLCLDELPSVVVVGSKGKATAATYASATLADAGMRVGTITSPPIITNRERIRVDGAAIDEAAYDALARRVAAAKESLTSPTARGGYLSPAGMYLVAGIAHMIAESVDVLVAEAGMGGGSDEVSLLTPDVVAVTPIFGEHIPILGRNVEEIALEKLRVLRPGVK